MQCPQCVRNLSKRHRRILLIRQLPVVVFWFCYSILKTGARDGPYKIACMVYENTVESILKVKFTSNSRPSHSLSMMRWCSCFIGPEPANAVAVDHKFTTPIYLPLLQATTHKVLWTSFCVPVSFQSPFPLVIHIHQRLQVNNVSDICTASNVSSKCTRHSRSTWDAGRQ